MKKWAVLVLVIGMAGYWISRPDKGHPQSSANDPAARSLTQSPNAAESVPAPVAEGGSQSAATGSGAGAVPTVRGGAVPSGESDLKPGVELAEKIEAAQKALPTHESMIGLKEEEVAHRAPPSVIEAGSALGDLAEYLEGRPGEFKAASRFYADCALNEKIVPAARALCLSTLQKNPDQWAQGVKEAIDSIPAAISALAAEL